MQNHVTQTVDPGSAAVQGPSPVPGTGVPASDKDTSPCALDLPTSSQFLRHRPKGRKRPEEDEKGQGEPPKGAEVLLQPVRVQGQEGRSGQDLPKSKVRFFFSGTLFQTE